MDRAFFKITNVSDEDLDMKLVSAPYGYFQLDLPDVIKAGESVECKLMVNPEYLEKTFEKSLTFEFSDATKTRFSVPIVRRLIGQRKAVKSTAPVNPKTGAKSGK